MMTVYSIERVGSPSLDHRSDSTEFEWDEGNRDKNRTKHDVTDSESEQVFFNRPFVTDADEPHSENEVRYYALGRTNSGRRLFISYTIRGESVRVISARDMTSPERKEYEHDTAEALETDSEV